MEPIEPMLLDKPPQKKTVEWVNPPLWFKAFADNVNDRLDALKTQLEGHTTTLTALKSQSEQSSQLAALKTQADAQETRLKDYIDKQNDAVIDDFLKNDVAIENVLYKNQQLS